METPDAPLEASASRRLLYLAEILSESFDAGGWEHGPHVIRLRGTLVPVRDLVIERQSLRELGTDFYGALANVDVPADCFGIGVALEGWAHEFDHRYDAQPERQGRIRSVVLMTRNGCEAIFATREMGDSFHTCSPPDVRMVGAAPSALRWLLGLDLVTGQPPLARMWTETA